MKIRVGFEMIYDFPQPTPLIAVLGTHFTRASDMIVPDHLTVSPSVPITPYRDGFGNWCSRIVAPAGRVRLAAVAQKQEMVQMKSRAARAPLVAPSLLRIYGLRTGAAFSSGDAPRRQTIWSGLESAPCRSFGVAIARVAGRGERVSSAGVGNWMDVRDGPVFVVVAGIAKSFRQWPRVDPVLAAPPRM